MPMLSDNQVNTTKLNLNNSVMTTTSIFFKTIKISDLNDCRSGNHFSTLSLP